MSISEIAWMAVVGLVVGLIARLLMPGRDPMGLIMTSILGIAGSFVGTFIGRTFLAKGSYYQARWIMSIVGALVLLFLYRVLFARRD
ncbi:MAG TPA: GlsB/YeaQ/YmgE family stress response membrane protein [Blastocatellia bacterium]|nr:GlsB/YeaQ/YmgE family stress response membrane protein [Blastocatellia bacterium]